MNSGIFIREFESGNMGDDAAWFDWFFLWNVWKKAVERDNILESLSWDNAPHHKNLKTFPYHVHLPDRVEENEEIEFSEALQRIEEIIVGKLDES